MDIDQLEIRWRCGARWYTLSLDADGTPRLDGEAPSRVRSGPARRGARWTQDEDDTVTKRVHAADDAGDVAVGLGRSRGSVLARAVKLGILSEAEAGLRYPVAPEEGAGDAP